MTGINDCDKRLANPCSLSLEVSLPGHSSVTLLAQAVGRQCPCPAHGTEQNGVPVRCKGKSICPIRVSPSPQSTGMQLGLGRGLGPS